MRIPKMINIELENVTRLDKVKNNSNLINELLEKHFDTEMLESEEEIIERIGKQEGQIKEFTASIASLKIKLVKVKKLSGKTKSGLIMRIG